MGQGRTCYGTCTCKPLDRTQPLQAMHKRSSPSPTCMANMIHTRESNPATSTLLFLVCLVFPLFLPILLCSFLFHLFYSLLHHLHAHDLRERDRFMCLAEMITGTQSKRRKNAAA
ncbi:unnamed protein product [Sphenostylis stenocarpa]|uniref:Uncharacterized protein n=1 Tax=Sphenostylis stenocarpa TaxID=92480 RepID=A0AA86SFC7_9FABA|nr:unnamed protein product [Sphenostylis stenocarpa]